MADDAKITSRAGITADQVKTVLVDLTKKKDKASEYAGQVGAATSAAVEKYGIDKNALTTVRRMNGMEETKRQAFLSGVIDLSYKAGFFDQIDAFDPMSDLLKEILKHVSENKQPPVASGDEADNIHQLN